MILIPILILVTTLVIIGYFIQFAAQRAEGFFEAVREISLAFAGDFSHRQGCVLDDYPGALDPEPFDELSRWHSALLSKHALEIPSAHPAALRQVFDREGVVQMVANPLH